MPQNNIRGRASQTSTTSINTTLRHPGPYLARIVSHLDKKFGGGLEVELLKSASAGNNYDNNTQTVTVKYASPFYGVTPLQNNDTNDAYSSTQQSYGFWAVPPDVGSKVLVMFVEGDISQGYWFACVQDDYMNFMIPEPRVSTTLTTSSTPSGLVGKKLPVGEYNKFLANPNNNYPTSQPKPHNDTFVEKLLEQGLVDDDIRGVTSTSARREAPSNVYGMSTPGPLDKRDGAPKHQRGATESKATVFSSRLGGHSIIMDDGDETILRNGPADSTPKEYTAIGGKTPTGDVTSPANELFRIRTRTGHQILLHNTEDLIYISNARGTTWVELTSNGKIDIFAQDSVSVHTQQDLNFSADRDINLSATENINMSAGKDIRINSGNKFNISTGDRIAIDSGSSISLRAATFMAGQATSSMSLTSGSDSFSLISGSDITMQAASDIGLLSATSIKAGAKAGIHLKSATGASLTSTGGDVNIKSSHNLYMEATASVHTYGTKISSQASGGIHTKSASIFVEASGNLSMKATTASLDGSTSVNINSGTASSALDADHAIQASDPTEPSPELPVAADVALIPSRMPQHEPWLQHENLNPASYTPDLTRAGSQSIDTFTQYIPDTYLARPGATTAGTTASSLEYADGNFPSNGTGTDEDAGTGTLPTGENVKIAHQYFINKGLTPEQSAGIVGNLLAESNINPAAYNSAGGGQGARGIAQWRNPRIKPFEDKYGPILQGTLQQQLDYIWSEITGGQRTKPWNPLENIKATTTATQAAAVWQDKFEGCGDASAKRAAYAVDVMRLYKANYSTEESNQVTNVVSDVNGNPVDFEFKKYDDTGALTMIVDEQQSTLAAIRKLPISRQLKESLNVAAHAVGVTKVIVVSGGQPKEGSGLPRKGSFRHDVPTMNARSGGMAADFDLYVNGKVLNGNNAQDREIMARFIAQAVSQGVRGIGWDSGTNGGSRYYMGPQRIHMDPYGASATNRALCVWGYNHGSATAVPWVVDAARKGLPK